MIKNYFKIAWRNLRKNKTFTFLNIIGLSVAFGVAILLSMTAFFELSYDKFHKVDDLYMVYSSEQTPEGSSVGFSKPVPFADALKAEMPGVANISRYLTQNSLVFHEGKELSMETAFVDPDFFSMFSFPIIRGNAENPLKNKSSVVITKEAAKKLFGNTKVVGETFTLLLNGDKKPFVIGAVLEEFPSQSSLDFELAVDFSNSPGYAENRNRWDSSTHQVYMQLGEGTSVSEFETKSHSFTKLHFKDRIENAKQDGAQPNEKGYYKSLRLLPFEDVHFADFEGKTVEVSRTYPYLILGIALLIL
ncbi:MAG TPA: ABC transporter permease, partial [Salinimicrobium sp.]|nr:ABC transporter permease [Salinimicrobium sp.]